MHKAYVLINTNFGMEDSVVRDLKKVEGVTEAFKVYGVYDIVAKVEAQTQEKIKEMISWKLRKISDVKSTITMMVSNKNQSHIASAQDAA